MSMLLLPSINHSALKSACTTFPSNKWCMQLHGPVQSLFCISKSINPQSVHQSTIQPLSLHAPFSQATNGACNFTGLCNHCSAVSCQSIQSVKKSIENVHAVVTYHQSTIQPLSLHAPFSQATSGACNFTGLCNHCSALASQ